jgi:glycosyltransferase involved in cell wall biosynthesis
MPPLEAMQAGTPVITSNNSSLPEVVGDAAVSLTYNDESAVIKAFEDFYFNEDLRKDYIARGLERAKMFSWEKCVGKMIHVMGEILST